MKRREIRNLALFSILALLSGPLYAAEKLIATTRPCGVSEYHMGGKGFEDI